jgi:NADPH2:quinone reductase
MDPKWLVKIPDWLDDETAAAVFLKGLTAQYLLRGAFHVEKGQTILYHMAAGAVGLLVCQWAHHLGATVIATVGNAEEAELVREYGCDHPIVFNEENVTEQVRSLTGGKGVAVAYDGIGALTFETTLACLQTRGMAVCFGTASGRVPPFDIFRLNRMGSLSIIGGGLADFISIRAELLQRSEELFEMLKSGTLRVNIGQRYKLADVAQAHRDVEARRNRGSSVIFL